MSSGSWKTSSQCSAIRKSGPVYTIRELPEEEAGKRIAEFWAAKKPRLNSRPQFLLDPLNDGRFLNLAGHYRALPSPAKHQALIRTVGAKAANLALLAWVTKALGKDLGIISPETMGVPFNFYDAFLNTEELLVTTFLSNWEEDARPDSWKAWPFERLRKSSVKGGTSVFQSEEEARRLTFILKKIKQAMALVYGKDPRTFAADVEWNIFGAKRWISINQARPFKPTRSE